MRVLRALTATLATALAVTVAAVPASSAVPASAVAPTFPDRIELPDGFQPEGITGGGGTTFYAGSLRDGAIYRGDVRTGDGAVLVPGEPGRVAVGLQYDARTDRLWVAGGETGTVTAYDGSTGEELMAYEFDAGFLNDVAVNRYGVAVTDSQQSQLVVIPFGPAGQLPATGTEVEITGDLVYGDGFNANGIVALPNGRDVLVVQSLTGELFRIDALTGRSELVPVEGRDLTGGDGLELEGRYLFVVRGGGPAQVDVVHLDGQFASGELLGALTDPGLDVPTTGDVIAGRGYVVNARFGTTPTPDTDYWITQLTAPQPR